nr:MAG TPA: hypothetical protein [Caudoviricetes sp.]
MGVRPVALFFNMIRIQYVPGLRNASGQPVLGLSCGTDPEGPWIKLRSDLGLPEFWEYISGNTDSEVSRQKRIVFRVLGLDRGTMEPVITSPGRALEFLLEHELSHIRNGDSWNPRMRMSETLDPYRIAIEARATWDAWIQLKKKYGSIQSN